MQSTDVQKQAEREREMSPQTDTEAVPQTHNHRQKGNRKTMIKCQAVSHDTPSGRQIDRQTGKQQQQQQSK